MTDKSASTDESVHVFDQTNGVLPEEPEPEATRKPRERRNAAEGDLPGATHVVLGGF